KNPCQYYEAGTGWKKISSNTIPATFMMHWAIEASDKFNWKNFGPDIPLEIIEQEVHHQYPGRWDGPFDYGARGIRFWDPSADNETAAIVRESGMQCFTGGQAFVPWSAILGRSFVNKFEADRVGGAIEDIWFDGRDYWHRHPDGTWNSLCKNDTGLELKVAKGLRMSKSRNDNFTEIDKALQHIHKYQRITCAAPLIHRPKGIIHLNGLRILNTSTAAVFQPSEKQGIDPAADFPWLLSYFSTFFDPVEQLDYFYAWLRRWYKSALDNRMLPGQASFFAGVPNTGKTLLSTVILSRIFGGHTDASSFLSGDDNFNSHLFQSAVWAVDDIVPLTDHRSHQKFSALIKKMAANRTFSIREKFKVDKTIEWNGRVVVTCNTDPESIRILPDVDLSNRDKINLFRVADRDTFTFPRDVADIIQMELPFFLRWLLDWVPPDHVLGDSRYGVQTYCEASLFEAARHSSSAYSFLEVLLKFFEGQVSDVWTGSATDLLTAMLSDQDGLAGIAAKYTTRQVGRELSKLASQGYPLTQRRHHATRIWDIDIVRIREGEGDTTPF
ncbi:MAG: primase-helicase family protein, partial [Kiritimatiellales bacterium]